MTKILTKNFFFKIAVLIAVIFIAFLSSFNFTEAAVRTSTATGGVWNAGSTWVGGVAPLNTDSVIIATTGGNSVTMGAARINAGLTVNAGAILDFNGAFVLTENGNVVVNGSVTGATGTIAANTAGITMDGSGTIGSIIAASQNFSFLSTANLTINNNITSQGRTVTNNGTINLNGNFARTGGTAIWTQGTNATLNISGAFTPAANVTVTATAAGNTINYNGAAQTLDLATYVNLTLSGSGVKTFPTGVTTINGIHSIEGTATTLLTGTITYGGASTLQYKGSTAQTTAGEFPATWSGTGGVKIENASGVTLGAAKNIGTQSLTIGAAVSNSIFNDGGFQLTSTGTLNLTSGTFKLGSAGTATVWPSFGTNNISSGTTVEYASGAAQTVSATPSYKNLTFSGAGAKTTAAGTVAVGGNWSTTGGTATLSTNNSNITVTGNITGTGAITSGSGTITLAGDWANSGTFTKGTGTVTYNGGSAQAVGALTYNNLIINKAGGSASLGGSGTRVDGVLTLTSGNITTSSNDIYISSTGSVSRTSGHIVGNLKKNIATGATSKTFEIGDASNYTPVSLIFGNVTVAGDLTAKTTAGDHPQISSSTIDSSKSINRYWTLTNSGISFNNYSVVLNFINPGDVDSGANTASFIVGLYNAGWTYPTVGTKNSTNTQATGVTGFGDFQLGEILVIPDTTAPAAVSNLAASNATNNSIDLSWTAPGDDNNTGTATTYDLRYSTSVITAGNFSSATLVTGEPSPSVAGSSESMTVTGLSANTLYYFALKTSDEVPNTSTISNVLSFSTLATADNTAPTVTAFSVPSTSDSLTITITSFTATDNIGVAGYLLTEGASAPLASDPGWTLTAPANYVFSTEGSKILYAWAKDSSGNVSVSLNDSIVVTLPSVPQPVIGFGQATSGGVLPTSVVFSGRAYPGGKIRVYRRSAIESSFKNDYLPDFDIEIDNNGDFNKTFTGLLQSDYLFALEGIDKAGQSGGIISFTANLISGNSLIVNEILLSPTIVVQNKSITKGNETKVIGYAYPNSNIELKIDNVLRVNSKANNVGYYESIINTSRFSPKVHFVSVRQIAGDGKASEFSTAKNFTVSALKYPQADFNGDNAIDIKDWSIFLFRWKANTALKAFDDMNFDGKVDIADLSVFLKAMKGL